MMYQFNNANEKWWQKLLVKYKDKHYPAELAILKESLRHNEKGVWLNSRSSDTGVDDLLVDENGKYSTHRIEIPSYVSNVINDYYVHYDVKKGIYDLALWNIQNQRVRFIEVKCPLWDKPTPEQKIFEEFAKSRGIETDIAEWEFID